MDAPAHRNELDTPTGETDDDPLVTYHETRPGKLVLTERNNTDAWIATDGAVDLLP